MGGIAQAGAPTVHKIHGQAHKIGRSMRPHKIHATGVGFSNGYGDSRSKEELVLRHDQEPLPAVRVTPLANVAPLPTPA